MSAPMNLIGLQEPYELHINVIFLEFKKLDESKENG